GRGGVAACFGFVGHPGLGGVRDVEAITVVLVSGIAAVDEQVPAGVQRGGEDGDVERIRAGVAVEREQYVVVELLDVDRVVARAQVELQTFDRIEGQTA